MRKQATDKKIRDKRKKYRRGKEEITKKLEIIEKRQRRKERENNKVTDK
jgi:hypothetical protein